MKFFRSALAGILSAGLILSPALAQTAHAQALDTMSSDAANIDQHSSALDPIALGPLAPLLFADNIFAAWAQVLQQLKVPVLAPDATRPPATAAPAQLRGLRHVQDNVWELKAYSPAMDRVITNDIILPPGGLENTQPRPSYYLLGGAGGGEDALWWDGGGASEFFRDKHVNVISPRGAYGSMMSDWAQPHDTHGKHKWATYLTKELPQLIDAEFHGNGRDGIAGLSNSGGPALELATFDPRFKVSGSFSGCPSTTGVLAQSFAWASAAFYGTDPARSFGARGIRRGRNIRRFSTSISNAAERLSSSSPAAARPILTSTSRTHHFPRWASTSVWIIGAALITPSRPPQLA
ncbi:alpha/beta hydrolase-fold protein [Corynebacterium guaraldiae]|uniref:alpha/beta hydrolase-fold protein n=1 Tax=Corynebacterium guaraldiae TaxID=3051103 RepID=UPI001E40F31E|nr:alpha/beta hydrolase-fold protein [Corynebacterium guaraldiae]